MVVLLIGCAQTGLVTTHRRRNQKKCGPLQKEESTRARSQEVADRDGLIDRKRESE